MIRLTSMAVNMEVAIPIPSVTAKPLTGPVPMTKRMMAAIQMRPNGTGSISAIAKWGGATAIKDTAEQEKVRAITLELRKKTTAELEKLGFDCIPSETNFFMVHLGRQVRPVIEEFRKRTVLVGRPFPPMLEHLRVSVGTADEMERFMVAFKEIFPNGKPAPTGA